MVRTLLRKAPLFLLPILVLVTVILFQPGSASAHCDSVDGPVVKAAQKALETGNINYVLPFIKTEDEAELKVAFEKALAARGQGDAAREVADRFFYETAVRIHRAGEGAPYTGLKPAGQDYGPALPMAEEAIEIGSAEELLDLMFEGVRHGILTRFNEVRELKVAAEAAGSDDVEAQRRYVEAALEFEKYILGLYQTSTGAVEGGHSHE